jgi:predicted nucleic acid-binding protein
VIRYLIDTNVLVYLHDQSDPARRERAAAVMRAVGRARSAALPVQALTEFAAVGLRKLVPPLAPEETRAQVEALATWFPTYPVTPAVVSDALRGVEEHQLPYFDAQIWAVARQHGVPEILSEDSRPGRLGGVRWLDPFDPDVDPAAL